VNWRSRTPSEIVSEVKRMIIAFRKSLEGVLPRLPASGGTEEGAPSLYSGNGSHLLDSVTWP
jgi:hypothetical protein